MLLKSLKIKDFRQFKGTQFIEFANDTRQKNVTIILGENGSGKTSLAQAFTWCLYGKTDFEDPILLCKATSESLLPGQEATVRVELSLIHSGVDYTVISELRYKKSGNGIIQPLGQRKFVISFKGKDGQQEFIPDLQSELRMKEILPMELSKYFFFDGERIGNMSKELRKGKSREFADAVRSLLGLSALTAAMLHLKGHGASKSVIRSYDEKYDAKADSRVTDYSQRINQFDKDIERIDTRLLEIDREEDLVDEKIHVLTEQIKENEGSKALAEERTKLIGRRQTLINRRDNYIVDLIKIFNKDAPSYFAKKMILDSMRMLRESQNLDKGVPDIHSRTIDHIIKNGRCICGAEVSVGNDAYITLNRLRDFIPPQSLGNLIQQFRIQCETLSKSTDSFYDGFIGKFGEIQSFEGENNDNEADISGITNRLEGLQDVGVLQADLSRFEKESRDLQAERNNLNLSKGSFLTSRERLETERQELTLKDKNNRRIEVYKAYAEYLNEIISLEYNKEEAHVREELSKEVDSLFRSIYNGGLSLSLDDKYNVQVSVTDHDGYTEDIETSTAQSISIIFAFITGVIKMARKNNNQENSMIVSEPYPLVMDAPLSAFDKTRIKTVCEVLPKVAEQVIIFIKDTDGELAETHMSERIGMRATFTKANEFETYIQERG